MEQVMEHAKRAIALYCALCGMPVKEENKVVRKCGAVKKYFCCKTCYKRYEQFRNPSSKKIKI
ncbi:hypothetical protein HYW21_02550 [Candidatus Woesearchaeota archaeon]|nr:hypothetical protein [Candidatus Woesearchaeota archaeon]